MNIPLPLEIWVKITGFLDLFSLGPLFCVVRDLYAFYTLHYNLLECIRKKFIISFDTNIVEQTRVSFEISRASDKSNRKLLYSEGYIYNNKMIKHGETIILYKRPIILKLLKKDRIEEMPVTKTVTFHKNRKCGTSITRSEVTNKKVKESVHQLGKLVKRIYWYTDGTTREYYLDTQTNNSVVWTFKEWYDENREKIKRIGHYHPEIKNQKILTWKKYYENGQLKLLYHFKYVEKYYPNRTPYQKLGCFYAGNNTIPCEQTHQTLEYKNLGLKYIDDKNAVECKTIPQKSNYQIIGSEYKHEKNNIRYGTWVKFSRTGNVLFEKVYTDDPTENNFAHTKSPYITSIYNRYILYLRDF